MSLANTVMEGWIGHLGQLQGSDGHSFPRGVLAVYVSSPSWGSGEWAYCRNHLTTLVGYLLTDILRLLIKFT